MRVEPDAFVETMTNRWTDEFSNIANDGLLATWRQLAETLNRQIALHDTERGRRWQVLQPKTGTGKTQGLATYCTMLRDVPEDHPGVLVVTRLIEEADRLAETISGLVSDPSYAVAVHSENREPSETLETTPVVIVTHRAFELAVDGVVTSQTMEKLLAFNEGRRKLVVIDEALDVIEEARINAVDLALVRSLMPGHWPERFGPQLGALKRLRAALDIIEAEHEREKDSHPDYRSRERLITKLEFVDELAAEDCDLSDLRREFSKLPFDELVLKKIDAVECARLRRRYDGILKAAQSVIVQWRWYARHMKEHTLNTARLIIPDGSVGAVVLDATAQRNVLYEVFDRKVDVIRPPATPRRYDNVTLHYSTGHRVGKVHLRKHGADEAPRFIKALEERFGGDRRVLIVTHKDVKPHLVACDHTFRGLDVATWGSVAGRNDWQEFDTVAIFGIPRRPDTWAANAFMAIHGPQPDEWLNGEADRSYRSHEDIRKALKQGQSIVDVVQAINRVRCRKVIDEHGNCAETEVILLLPKGEYGDVILDGVCGEMTGIKPVEWDYDDRSKVKARRSKFEPALEAFAESMPEGRRSASDVKRHLRIPPSTWDRLAAKLRQGGHLSGRLAERGVSYVVQGQGRGARSWLEKRQIA